jgi:hypothetical protein
MFSRLFGGGKSAGRGEKKGVNVRKMITQGDRDHEERTAGKEWKQIDGGKIDNRKVDDIVMNDAEREVYRFKLPVQERGFTDLIAAHEPGTRFQHVAITGSDPEDYGSRNRRLVQLQPRINSRPVDLPEHINVNLVKDVEDFPFSQIVSNEGDPVGVRKRGGKGKKQVRQELMKMPFILVKRAVFIFHPLISMSDEYTGIKVALVDNRFRHDQERRTVSLSSNLGYAGEMNLDYSFPRSSVEKMHLTFSAEVPILNTGEQWGACQVFLEVEESDFPIIEPYREVAGTARLPTTGLAIFKTNPAHLNLIMRENHKGNLQEMYADGDIANETEAITEKTKKATYSQSSAPLKRRSQIVKKVDPTKGWEGVIGMKPQIPDDQASYDLDEEDQSALPDSSDEDSKSIMFPIFQHGGDREEHSEKKVGFLPGNFPLPAKAQKQMKEEGAQLQAARLKSSLKRHHETPKAESVDESDTDESMSSMIINGPNLTAENLERIGKTISLSHEAKFV